MTHGNDACVSESRNDTACVDSPIVILMLMLML